MSTSRRDAYIGGAFAVVAAIVGAVITGLVTSDEPAAPQGGSPGTSVQQPAAGSPTPARTPTERPPTTAASRPGPPTGLGEVRVYLSRDSGPSGTLVRVSGEGYPPSASLVIRFHTTEVGSTRASSAGTFSNVAVRVPSDYDAFAPQQFAIGVTNRSGPGYAQAPFTLT